MNLFLGRDWGRLLAGAVLSLLSCSLFAPSAARAECGDYVHVQRGASSQDGVDRPHAITDHEPARTAPAPKPCSGPRCSRGTPVPLAPPVTAAPVQIKDLTVSPSDLFPDDESPPRPLSESPAASPDRHGCSIYHPPRPF